MDKHDETNQMKVWNAESEASRSIPLSTPRPKRTGLFVGLGLTGAVVAAAVAFLLWKKPNTFSGTHADGNQLSGDLPHVTLQSDPSGASVFLNDRLIGTTPLILQAKPGTYGLRLEKTGRRSITTRIDLPNTSSTVKTHLPFPETGSIKVHVNPKGAEVLINGESVGHTPLQINRINVGLHEVVIRKTNFETESMQVHVLPNQTVALEAFALEDKLLTSLKRLVQAEPQRVGHYVDLGHYLFLQERPMEAADTLAKGLEVAQKDLVFPEGIPIEDRAAQMRLRSDDIKRMNKEIKKLRAWGGRKDKKFADRLDMLQVTMGKNNLADWKWVEPAVRNMLRKHRPGPAEQLAAAHIQKYVQAKKKKGGKDPKPPAQGIILLTEVRLRQRNWETAEQSWELFRKHYKNNPVLMRQMGNLLYSQRDRFRNNQRDQVLEASEKTLHVALEKTKDKALKALCLFEIGNVLRFRKQGPAAINSYQQSLQLTANADVKEDRMISLARALWENGRDQDAAALYKKLVNSKRRSIRASARAGLTLLEVDPTP